MVKVVALTRGYIGGIIREAGDEFVWPNGAKLGSWVKVVDGEAEPEADADADASADAEPETPEPEAAPKKPGRKKAETVTAPTAEPFADAPEPVRVKNEVNDLTGGTQPDWVA